MVIDHGQRVIRFQEGKIDFCPEKPKHRVTCHPPLHLELSSDEEFIPREARSSNDNGRPSFDLWHPISVPSP